MEHYGEVLLGFSSMTASVSPMGQHTTGVTTTVDTNFG